MMTSKSHGSDVLRVTLARHPDALNACRRFFIQEIFRWQSHQALTRGQTEVRGAAVNFPQRFGGSLNLNVHFHAVVPDAYFYRDQAGWAQTERLVRYCARPPLSLQGLSLLPTVQVVYQLKNPIGRHIHRIMEPSEFLSRLCALIPSSRHPLIRFHGVLAPNSSCPPTSKSASGRPLLLRPHRL